ncbi:3'-5' exonuclease, partial [Candidatus Nomurabacteria bacterium]|nr:3'-5' exonuclease [Candidatus Nomurabacteria bacterium]
MYTDISKRPIAMTDLETSGAVFGEHEILEIGLVLFDQHTFEIIDTLNIKIKPEHIENAVPAALERNGYKAENWTDA